MGSESGRQRLFICFEKVLKNLGKHVVWVWMAQAIPKTANVTDWFGLVYVIRL